MTEIDQQDQCPRRNARRVKQSYRDRLVVDLIDNFEAHLAGGAFDDSEGSFVTAGIQVVALGLHDVHHLFARDFADFFFVRFF
jgi:hypothetical protein